MKVSIVDYGVGNLNSAAKAFEHLGYQTSVSSDPETLSKTDVLVLPGQGAFSTAMENLNQTGLIPLIKTHIEQQKPFIGICVGFQILFENSEEMGSHKGLGFFPGTLKHFPQSRLSIPQMGWNKLLIERDTNHVFKGLSKEPLVYFVHSYYLETTSSEIISAKAEYGLPFVAMIQTKQLLATQFHPEKSGSVGLTILKNFLESCGAHA